MVFLRFCFAKVAQIGMQRHGRRKKKGQASLRRWRVYDMHQPSLGGSDGTSAQWIAPKSSKVRYVFQVGNIAHNLSDCANSGRKPLGCTEYENQNSSYSYRYFKARKLYLLLLIM